MGTDPDALEFCGPATPAEAAESLTRLAEGIRTGGLSVSLGEDEITVLPVGDLSLEIDASERKGKDTLEVLITWQVPKGLRGD
jgi:amphi-Trp domain-containing protein